MHTSGYFRILLDNSMHSYTAGSIRMKEEAMGYVTATEAARRIGVTEKTVRDWVKEGKIEALHPAKNRMAIAEDVVEHLAEERRLYYGTKPQVSSPIHTLPEASAQDIEARLASLAQSVANLNTTVASQIRRIDELTKRIAELESRHVSASPQPQQSPQISTTEPSSDMLPARDFAQQIGIEYTLLDGYARRGIAGEKMDVTEVPHPTRKGYTNRYFTEEQQKKAIELLKKHKRL